VLRVVANDAGEHAKFGVIDPGDAARAKPGATGVGMRVVVRDREDKELLAMVIGNEEKDRPGLHYVRRVGQDPVYVVAVSTDRLSTKFEDWIEKDLLRISSWDVKSVNIQDYTVANIGGQLAMDPRSRWTVVYSDNEPRWTLQQSEVFSKERGQWQAVGLAPDEELDTAKLDTMKSALDDLKIVDVKRKPEGFSKKLKATGQLVANREVRQSLAARGFYLLLSPDGEEAELYSNKGEMRVLMKDGVEYVLRFGEIAGTPTEPKPKDKKKDEKKDDKKKEDAASGESTSPGMNRYLFIMAEFNPASIPKPELEPLPKEEKAAEAKKTEGQKPEGQNKEEAKKEEAKKEESSNQQEKKDDSKPDPKAERERIEKENKRKQEEYQEKLKKGEERVKELNNRFADWYYVISDEVYKKIHLGRQDIIKKKEKKEEPKATPDAKPDQGSSVPKPSEPAPQEAKKDSPATVPQAPQKEPPEGSKPEKAAEPAKKPSSEPQKPSSAPEGTKKDAPTPAKAGAPAPPAKAAKKALPAEKS